MEWWKNKQLRPAFLFLGSLIVIALARDLLANSRPLYCRIEGKSYFPGVRNLWADPRLPYHEPALDSIRENFLWQHFDYEYAVFAPIPFSPGELPLGPDKPIKSARPGAVHPGPHRQFRHWLGTDSSGYDVAAGLVSGARIAILTGALAVSLAFGIGLILGAIAGYWGDDRLQVSRGRLIMVLTGLVPAIFYASVVYQFNARYRGDMISILLAVLSFSGILWIFSFLGKKLARLPFFAGPVTFPADMVIMRIAEVFTSVPGILVIIAFAAMLKSQSLWAMITLIGIVSWPGTAQFIRSELLRIRELDYVQVARSLGQQEWRILIRHALPNAMRPAYTILAFGVATAILLEAGLSFLGYGDFRLHGATWGSLLQNARTNPQYWWITLPPGLAIGFTILALHRIGEALSDRR